MTDCGAPGGNGVLGRSGNGGAGNGQGGGSSHIDGNGITVQDQGHWGISGVGGTGAPAGDIGGVIAGGAPGSIVNSAVTIIGPVQASDGLIGLSGTNFGSGGGGGGTGIYLRGPDLTNLGWIYGGVGGNGGSLNNNAVGNAGGGGGGGAGLVNETAFIRVVNGGWITGGRGGNGGDSGFGGGGGGGGDGLLSLGGFANITNSGNITGGAGGFGGTGTSGSGDAGSGGTGVNLSGRWNHLTNSGTITGGTGDGGGIGVITRGYDTITNSGMISGALNGLTRSAAIQFGGPNNVINLQAGSRIIGDLVFDTGASATIAAQSGGLALENDLKLLGGSAVTFDTTVLNLSVSGSISGNGTVNLSGGNTLTLSGANANFGGTIFIAGTLVANHADGSGVIDALGTGLIALNGGRIHSATDGTISNSLFMNAGTTGTISTATGTTITLGGGNGQSFSLQGHLVIGASDATGRVVFDVDDVIVDPDAIITVANGILSGIDVSIQDLTARAAATQIAAGGTLIGSGGIRNLQDAVPGRGGTLSWGENSNTSIQQIWGGNFSGKLLPLVQNPEIWKGTTDTLVLNGDNAAYDGATIVFDGKLVVGDDHNKNASLGGRIIVAPDGTLGGYGTIGGDTTFRGGTLSPGNSVGTLTINGNLTLEPGSILETEIAHNSSDFVDVRGSAAISDSSVSITAIDPKSSYQSQQTYTIMHADGGISGTFGTVVSKSAFLDLSVTYSANDVLVRIAVKQDPVVPVDPETPTPGTPVDPEIPSPGTSEPEQPSPALFTTVAQTRNQLATAGGLDTLAQTGSSLALYNTLLMLSADEARAAFDSLSGEAYASAKGVLINDSQFIRNAALGRLQQAFGGAPATPINALSYAGSQRHVSASASAIDAVAPASIAPTQNLYTAWGYAYGAWTRQDSDGNAGSVKSSVGGFVTGIDGAVLDTWRLGLLAGYSHSSFDMNDRAASGSSDNYTLGAYTGTEWTLNNGHALAFRSGLAYTWHNVDMNRSVAFPGLADNLTGDYNAGSFQVFGELGYKVHYGTALFEPYAGLAYVRLKTDSFNETGQTAAALSVQSGTTDTSFSTLGLRASTEFALGSITATARADLGWRHAYGNITPISTASFIGSDAFTVSGLPIAEDAALIEAGLDFKLTEDATLGISYNGQFASGAKQNGVNAKLSVSF